MRLMDLTGKRFGRWSVLEREPRRARKPTRWICRCDCGVTRAVYAAFLRDRRSRSCGCLAAELRLRHGGSRTPEYKAWVAMIQRCENPRNGNYPNYGARGISVCQAWRESFESFFGDVGPRPSAKHSIDRIDTGGNYAPGNVRWGTRLEQAATNRRSKQISIGGATRTIRQWCKAYGIAYQTALSRLGAGWSPEVAFTSPAWELGK